MNLTFWRHMVRARLHELRRRPEAAIAEYRAALRADPGSARVHHTVSFLLAAQKRYAEAETHLREALRLDPGNADAWFNLGFLHDHQRQMEPAIEAFREAVRLDPKLDRAWYGLGISLAVHGRYAEAAQALQRAADLQPMNGTAWYHLGMTYHTLQLSDKVTHVAEHLNRFDRKRARQLIHDSGRNDLRHLVADLRQ